MCSVSPSYSSDPLSGSRSDEVRVYQNWKGNNTFFLRGRLVFGPDVRPLALTVLLITAPVSVFCGLVARNLANDFSDKRGLSIMLVAIVFTLYDLILLLLTCGRDPGIIPRNLHPPELESFEGTTPQLRLPRIKNVEVNGTIVKAKYCDTCMLYRPPRCSHCSICNNCVECFDHHCPWIGQCIGLRNYRFYFLFVFSTTLLCVYVFGFCWVYITRIMSINETSIWKAMIKTPASIVLIVYTFVAFCLIGGLTSFHLYLISTNQTTYENFKHRHDHHANIYDKGVVKNFKEIFCGFTPPSKNNFRGMVHKELPLPSRDESSEFVSLEFGKGNGDIEMGRKGVWGDRNEVLGDVCVALDHTDQGGRSRNDESLNTIENGDDAELGEMSLEIYVTVDEEDPLRCLSLGRKSGSWEMLPKVHDLASRLGEMNRTGEKSSSVRSTEMRL